MKTKAIVILAMVILPLTAHAKPEASLRQCQSWKDRIDYYSDLRREGGSAREMERWRTERRKISEEFRAYDCHEWQRKLK